MTSFDHLEMTRDGAVVRVVLNRSKARNALSIPLIAELRKCFAGLKQDRSVRLVVLAGNGPTFCAGADISWVKTLDDGDSETWAGGYTALEGLLVELCAFDKPIICRVAGNVIGAGVALASVCDMVIAPDTARFGLPELHLGMVPTVIVPFLVRRIGGTQVQATCIAEPFFSADRARELSIVTRVVPEDIVDSVVEEAMTQVLKCAPDAVAAFKRMMADIAAPRLADHVAAARKTAFDLLGSPEMEEGTRALLHKTPPSWSQS